jgi:hypothetical protein
VRSADNTGRSLMDIGRSPSATPVVGRICLSYG